MAEWLVQILGDHLSTGLVITKHLPPAASIEPLSLKVHGPLFVIQGDHPIPADHSLAAGKKVLEFLSGLARTGFAHLPDLGRRVSVGGCSTTRPIIVRFASWSPRRLLRCGATIEEINTIRRRLDLLKGGGITKISNQATVVSLIISDVIGNPLEAIASGPTVPDPTTRSEMLAVIEKYSLREVLPSEIILSLEKYLRLPRPAIQFLIKFKM